PRRCRSSPSGIQPTARRADTPPDRQRMRSTAGRSLAPRPRELTSSSTRSPTRAVGPPTGRPLASIDACIILVRMPSPTLFWLDDRENRPIATQIAAATAQRIADGGIEPGALLREV